MDTRKAEAEAVAEVVSRYVEAKEVDLENGHAVLVAPLGLTIHSLKKFTDEYLDAPERREGTAVLQELDSFIAHVNRFKDADSAIFGDPNMSAPKLTGVLDYHRAGGEGAPRFGKHRAVYSFPLDKAWKTWTGAASTEIGQRQFAEFIESNVLDIIDPREAGESANRFANALGARFAAGPELMELSRGLIVRQGSHVRNAVNLSTGEVQIQYDTEHTDERGQPLNVPRAFILGIPVFRGGHPYQVPVRLRYRVKENLIVWSFEMWRLDLVFEDAFKGATTRAQTETALPLFIGSPEA